MLPTLLALVAVVAIVTGGFVVLRPGQSPAKPGDSSVSGATYKDYSDLTPPIPETGDIPAAEQTKPIEGHLTLGDTAPLAQQNIGAGGGTIAAGGLQLTVLAGTLTSDTSFSVSQAPITGNEFSNLVTPLTPLYQVDDGDAVLAEPITVTMPVQIPAGQTAMGFSYDYDSGTIAPLIPVSQDSTTLTAGAVHFSGFFAGLLKLATTPTTTDSGFRPGVDDWQFPNYGSYVAPGGHCEGQSATAIWYYVTQKLEGGAPALSGLYDNNGKSPKTPDLWADDSNAYRFVSSVHNDPLSVRKTYRFFRNMWNNPDDRMTYASFWTAITATGEPQMIRISKAAEDGGHTMIVYRVTADRLFIADPNYPGRLRTIHYDAATGKLSAYSSGDNAGNIAAAGATVYTRFSYVPWQTSHSSEAIAKHWAEFKAGTAGDALFPAYDVEALAGQDADGRDVWEPVVDGYATDEDQLTLRISDPNQHDDVRMKAYLGTTTAEAVAPGEQITVALKDGANSVGLLEQGHKTGWADWKYDDFLRLNVVFEPSPGNAASTGPAVAGGHWVLTSVTNAGGPDASSFDKPGEKRTIQSSSGQISTLYNYDGPPHRHEESSSSWGPPPAAAAPGDAWTTTLAAQATCLGDIDESWAAGPGVAVVWTEAGSTGSKQWDAAATCQKGSASTELSWTFPTYRGAGDKVEITVDGGDSNGGDTWTYKYEWKA